MSDSRKGDNDQIQYCIVLLAYAGAWAECRGVKVVDDMACTLVLYCTSCLVHCPHRHSIDFKACIILCVLHQAFVAESTHLIAMVNAKVALQCREEHAPALFVLLSQMSR